jgi:hypothetical protein
MYRLRLPDGTLSDMVNLTRAKDALRALMRKRDVSSMGGGYRNKIAEFRLAGRGCGEIMLNYNEKQNGLLRIGRKYQ